MLVAQGPEHPLRRRAAKQRGPTREPGIEGHFVTVVPLLLVVVGADHVVDARQGGGADVVHRDDAAVERARDVDQCVIAEGLQRVGLPRQVVEGPMEPARVHLDALHQFMLHPHGRFDVVHAPGVRVGERLRARAEPLTQLRQIDLAPRGQVDASELSLRDVVSVEIGPGYDRLLQDQRVELVREVDRLGLLVPVHAGLEGGFRVAEQVIDHAEPWSDVLPHRHRNPVEAPCRREPAGSG